MRLLWFLWSCSSLVSGILCILGYILPYWLKGSVPLTIYDLDDPYGSADLFGPTRTYQPSYLGLFRRCVYPVYATVFEKGDEEAPSVLDTISLPEAEADGMSPLVKWHIGCGHYRLVDVPHVTWQMSLACLTLACVILAFLTMFILLIGFELSLLVHHVTLFRVCQVGLLLSGFLTLTACALYPLGWRDNGEVRQICGQHLGGFSLERCRLGWAYLLTLLGGFLAIFSAGLPSLYFRQFCITRTVQHHLNTTTNASMTSHTAGKAGAPMMLVGRLPADKNGDQQQLYASSTYMATSLDESMCLGSSGYPAQRFPPTQCLQWPSVGPMWTPCLLVPAKSQSEVSAETTGSLDGSASVQLDRRTPVVVVPKINAEAGPEKA